MPQPQTNYEWLDIYKIYYTVNDIFKKIKVKKQELMVDWYLFTFYYHFFLILNF